MNELDKVLGKNEKVLWEGKPQFWPYLMGSLFGLALLFLFFIPFVGTGIIFVIMFLFAMEFSFLSVIITILGSLVAISLVLAIPLYTYLVYKRIHFAITDKRIITQTGLIGRDFKSVDYDKLTDLHVDVGLADKVFGKNCGTIMFTAATPTITALPHITDPYNVFKLLKKTSHDVKTDIHYPNDLRPKANKGYKTKYKP